MRRQNKCALPSCGKKFGLISYFRRGSRYCSTACKKAHTAILTAEAVKKMQWFKFLGLSK